MTTAVYVSNADDGTVSVLALDEARGSLSMQQTLAVGGTVMPMAVHPSRRWLFAARRSEPLAAVTMAIGPSGALKLVGEGPLPASMAHIAIDRTGRWLLAASYGEHVVSVSRIGDDGVVAAAHQVLTTGRHAHAIVCDPSNRHAYSTALGADALHQWRFDATAGLLEPNPFAATLAVRPGAGPRHMAWHPGGRVAYLLHELDASLDVLALDEASGTLRVLQTLSTLPPGFEGKPWAADVHVCPDGRHVYTSERTGSTLTGFRCAADGRLKPTGHWAAPAQPRGFAITGTGRWLLAAGQRGRRVWLQAIDPEAGTLSLRAEAEVGDNPNWVETVALS